MNYANELLSPSSPRLEEGSPKKEKGEKEKKVLKVGTFEGLDNHVLVSRTHNFSSVSALGSGSHRLKNRYS